MIYLTNTIKVGLMALAIFLVGCATDTVNTTNKAPEAKAPIKAPEFNHLINPFSRDSEFYYSYDNNGYVKFYETAFSKKALQECFVAESRLFLDKNQMPEIINVSSFDPSKDAKLARFYKNHFVVNIGGSFFSDISINQKEALALGVALRVKYIILMNETLNEYVTLINGQKVKRESTNALFAIGAERDEGYDFAPCTRLMKEFEELYGNNASKRK